MAIVVRALKQTALMKFTGIFVHAAMVYACGYIIMLAPNWADRHERIINAYLAAVDLLRLFR